MHALLFPPGTQKPRGHFVPFLPENIFDMLLFCLSSKAVLSPAHLHFFSEKP